MNSLLNTGLKALTLCFAVLVAQTAITTVTPSLAWAEEAKPRKTPALRNKVYEQLSVAQQATEQEHYNEALEVLDELKNKRGRRALNSYELANVYNLYAFIYYAQQHPAKALQAYKNVVAQPDIPLAMEINTRYTMAQLFLMQDQWKDGINELNRWFKLANTPSVNAYILRGQAYYQLKEYDNALADIETAIEMHRAKGKKPREQWLSLTRFLHYEKRNISKVIEVLEELLVLYPKKDYWMQIAHMYAETNQEKKQLAAMESAYVQNLLTRESELVNLAYLYLNADAPYKAGKVLELGLKNNQVDPTARNLELQASAWRRAQELDKAIAALNQAASKSEKGELWTQLGNLYLDKEEYALAIEAFKAGLKKGRVKRPDSTHLSLGMALFNQKQYKQARSAFNEAKKDKRSKKFAQQWLKYMEKEVSRIKSLAQS